MPALQPLIISAPFGNYVQPERATPTMGTFTALRRPGRLWRILRTVRYSPSLGAWVNKIGLRNPGIDWLVQRAASGRLRVGDKLVSIHGFDEADWAVLLEKAAGITPLGIELNMSCPNVGHVNWPPWLFERAAAAARTGGFQIVVKLPPVNYATMFRQALDAGLRTFHACNTIPVPAGGVSGKPLKPVSLQCIADLRATATSLGIRDLVLIGGGGITTTADIDDYVSAGASHVALGTKCFNPLVLISNSPLRPLIDHAHSRLGERGSTPDRSAEAARVATS